MSNEKLESVRFDCANLLRQNGIDPYSNAVPDDLVSIGRVIELFGHSSKDELDDQKHSVGSIAGRIMLHRVMGKVQFAKLRDGSGDIQLMLRKDSADEAAWDLLKKHINLGDIVSASGSLTRTQTGELTVLVQSLNILSKAIIPPPKFDGIVDTDLRYRQRYADLIANPEVKEVFKARSYIISTLRSFMNSFDFMEVETPILHPIVGGASARPFVTHHNSLGQDFNLRIAPELYLKRLVVGGFDRVFEIGKNLRNEGMSTRHNPEFTMLEMYQAYSNRDMLIGFVQQMIYYVFKSTDDAFPNFASERTFSISSYRIVKMFDAILDALNMFSSCLGDFFRGNGIDSTIDSIYSLIVDGVLDTHISPEAKCNILNAKTYGQRLFAMFEGIAEPHLVNIYRTPDGSQSLPVFILDYPVEVSPLARSMDRERQQGNYGKASIVFTERFELFIDGIEIGNGFSELNDPLDQEERFRHQVIKLASGNLEAMGFDEDYINALKYGLPPTAGFGMGIDRLVMLITNSKSIKDVILFPTLRRI